MTRRGLLQTGFATLAASPAFAQKTESNAMRYTALALQVRCDAVNADQTPEAAETRKMATIARIGGQIGASKGFISGFNGTDLKLVCLPEYFLTSFPLGETRAQWKAKAAIDVNGKESEALGALAQKFKLFLCGNAYENDPNFPDLYFQSNLIWGPNGDVVLRYRRLISLYAPTPYDVLDRYLEVYGADALFPVADTEIGKLATIASEEILYPEIARMHAMKGAEVLLHPTSEVGSPALTAKDIAKRARAIESMAYVVSANSASIEGIAVPAASTDGMSKIVDWNGKVLVEAGTGETMVANAVIDLPALRDTRRRTGMTNFLARQPNQLYADAYAKQEFAPANATPDGKMRERSDVLAAQRAVIDRLVASGVLK